MKKAAWILGTARVTRSADAVSAQTNEQLNIYAEVAELADALDSGSSGSNTVWVQVPSPAPKIPNASVLGIFTFYLFTLHFSLFFDFGRDFWKVRSKRE